MDMQIKLLTIGDSAVGKTCLLLRYASDSFQTTFITTIGIDFKTKDVTIDGKQVRLQIWDTAGQERFRTITTSYFNGAHGIMLVYDVCDRASFNSIRNWVDQIQQHADQNVNLLLVGNKCDLLRDGGAASGHSFVTKEEGEALAREYNVGFFETSAKEDINVDVAFMTLAKSTMERLCKQDRPRNKGHQLDQHSNGRGRGGGGGGKNCCG